MQEISNICHALKRFYAMLADDPVDWQTRSILADCYADLSKNSIEECLRWMVANKKAPHLMNSSMPLNKFSWTTDLGKEYPQHSQLASGIWDLLQWPFGIYGGPLKVYHSLEYAEFDFYNAFLRYTDGRTGDRIVGGRLVMEPFKC